MPNTVLIPNSRENDFVDKIHIKIMISVEEMESRFTMARRGYGLPDMIIGNTDFTAVFGEYDSIERLIEDYDNDFSEFLNMSRKEIVFHYVFAKGPLTADEQEF